MHRADTTIADLFRVPGRFMRSVQLERDFHDLEAMDQYVLTPAMAEAFARVAEGLRTGSGRRAWRITGDYGVGKSSFALVMAHLLTGGGGPIDRIREALGWKDPPPAMWPVLVTGAREAMVPALARGIAETVRKRAGRKRSPTVAGLIEQARHVEAGGGVRDLEALVSGLRDYAGAQRAGVLLIVDEMGKFLEYAGQRPNEEDVFVLQRLAEIAVRSGERRFMVLGLLHQGFHAYAERLPSSARHEWDKVAGRFEEIVFDQPLVHTAALVSGALRLDQMRLPPGVRGAARAVSIASDASGWFGGATGSAPEAASLYPLHPTLLPVLVRFFARFGQHERSLFGFLLSSEPFALRAFAERPARPASWYGLAEFYDYVRAVFGHRLAGASYRSQWIRIVTTVEAAADRDRFDLAIMKVVAILSLIDAEDLLATGRALRAAFSPVQHAPIDAAVERLCAAGLLFRRGASGGLRLWPQSAVSLEKTLASAAVALAPFESVAVALDAHLDRGPVLARRHYVETGTLRYFEMRYATAMSLADALSVPASGDGVVVIALGDDAAAISAAVAAARAAPYAGRDDVLVGIPGPLQGLAPELRDLQLWEWVSANVPELVEDAYAGAEVARQLASARRSLALALADRIGFKADQARDMRWFRGGKPTAMPSRGGMPALLSEVCDDLYPQAPLVVNELINRNVLSSAASAARMRLVEGMFAAPDRPFVGIDPDKAPPEKSMYLSILRRGLVHVEEGARFSMVEPAGLDPLRLRPALDSLSETIVAARGVRVPVSTLFAELARPPFGVRAGVSPLLLAILLCVRGHELAIYENGTFLHRFGPSDYLRLMKTPGTFEVQHCRIAGVRLEVFKELATAFARRPNDRRQALLDVVKPLCEFAAQLPEYTRRTAGLEAVAVAVRNVLLSAREPTTMLFRDLPQACGSDPFESDDPRPADVRVPEFIRTLQAAIDSLRAAYPGLLSRIIGLTAVAVGDGVREFDRARLANRASRVSLAAREPRLRTFALRLRDPGLSDEAWAEALASFIVSKPPARWSQGDEARFAEEVGMLGELFHKVEATAFREGAMQPAQEAIRLNLTRGDGEDLVRIVAPMAEDQDLEGLAEVLRGRLPQDAGLRLQVLTRLLWSELEHARPKAATAQSSGPMNLKGRLP